MLITDEAKLTFAGNSSPRSGMKIIELSPDFIFEIKLFFEEVLNELENGGFEIDTSWYVEDLNYLKSEAKDSFNEFIDVVVKK